MDEILTRGVETVLPDKQALTDRLDSGPIRLYFGIDPTAPSLHLGHLASLLKVRDFQLAGHEVVVMFGDFTARIGDPTDKDAVRKILSQEEVESNMADYENQVLKILDPAKTTFRKNSEWYRQMPLEDFINLTTKITVGQNLKRDMFQRRQKLGKEIYVNEFLYPILHGYDCLPLAAELEIGGNDQLFNMLTGRDLAKKISNRDKFVLTLKLLVDPSGAKMGKTTGNMARLDDEPKEMFGKIMSWPDTLMPLGFEILTRVPTDTYQAALSGHPKEAKLLLAKEIVKTVFGNKIATQALENFEETFTNGTGEGVAQEIKVKLGESLDQVLLDQGLVKSKSDFRRLVDQGAIDYAGEIVTDLKQTIDRTGLVRAGKHRFLKITLK